MFRTFIVDDEDRAINSLKTILKWYCEDDVEVIGQANSPSTAWPQILEIKPDLIFLDVEMKSENGFMLLERIRREELPIDVIFTTGHSEYAIDAIRKDAFDYLLKPVDGEDLKAAVDRLKSKKVTPLDPPPAVPTNKPSLSLPMQDQVLVVPLEDIIRCSSDRNYTRFFLVDGSRHLISKNLGTFQEFLTENGFFRTHKSHLINLAHLKSYLRQDGGQILMSDGSEVPLARAQRSAFFEILGI